MMNTQHQGWSRTVRAGALFTAILFAGCATTQSGKEVKVMLSGANETPPVTSGASGSGSFKVGEDKSVSGSVTTSGVVVTAAHIHVGAAGKNGPVAIGLVKTADNVWSVPADAKFTDDQYKAYLAGETYVNVHSAANKGGEIRGQLQPSGASKGMGY